MSASYRAVLCRALEPGGRIAVEAVPREALGPGELRLSVKAAGVNFPDLLMVQGRYQLKPPLPFTPGLEAAGVVLEAPAGSPLRPGDAAISPLRTGGWAEEAVAPAAEALPLPGGFSFAEGAAFHTAAITAYHALATRARLQPGRTLLVLGAAGGVGLASVQVGAALGATVLAVASTEEKRAVAARHGAAHTLDPAVASLSDAVRELTAGAGADVVLDPVGAPPEELTRCIAWGGRILLVGFAGGAIPSYPANRLLLKGATLHGVRAGEFGRRFPARRRDESEALLALAAAGRVTPFVSAILPLSSFREALDRLANREAIGRIVLDAERV